MRGSVLLSLHQHLAVQEIILHTLFESGISRVQDVERYISDDVERHGTRLGDLEKKLVGAYREVVRLSLFVNSFLVYLFFQRQTAVDVLDDEGLFEDEEEEGGALTMCVSYSVFCLYSLILRLQGRLCRRGG